MPELLAWRRTPDTGENFMMMRRLRMMGKSRAVVSMRNIRAARGAGAGECGEQWPSSVYCSFLTGNLACRPSSLQRLTGSRQDILSEDFAYMHRSACMW